MIEINKFLKKALKIELVYATQNGLRVTYQSEINDIREEKIFFNLPYGEEFSFENIPLFSKLNIIIYTQDGVLTGNVNLFKKENGVACISFPYNNQFCQRREDTRIPMHINFELNLKGFDDFAEKYLLKSKNISGKGIACITSEPLPDFETAQITMFFDNAEIEALCRKVYSRELILNDDKMFLNGIAFTEISKENVKMIVKNCLKFQIASHHNERLFESL